MDPVLIIIGLVLGIAPIKPRIWLIAVGVLSLLWAVRGAYDSTGGVGDFIIVFLTAAANLGIGIAIGTAISLLFEGRAPGSRRV